MQARVRLGIRYFGRSVPCLALKGLPICVYLTFNFLPACRVFEHIALKNKAQRCGLWMPVEMKCSTWNI